MIAMALLAASGECRLLATQKNYTYGIEIAPPWANGGRLRINLPEHLEHKPSGWGILRYSDKRGKSWNIAPDGRSATLDVMSLDAGAQGARVTGSIKVKGGTIELSMKIAAGRATLQRVKPLYCLQYQPLKGFPQWRDNLPHTFVLVDGKAVAMSDLKTKNPKTKVKGLDVKGCDQLDNGFADKYGGYYKDKRADAAMIAVTSLDNRRCVVYSWTPGKTVFSNSGIPCMHGDPFYGDIRPGEAREATAVVVFVEGPVEKAMKELAKAGHGRALKR